ncbi:DUF6083 domain-containing protein [Streptomyces anthocyanicus]|uniref:DUF6083 domain-containing protein n=2 Tax=Streptomyces TaxID=1883 RepID=UPI0036558999
MRSQVLRHSRDIQQRLRPLRRAVWHGPRMCSQLVRPHHRGHSLHATQPHKRHLRLLDTSPSRPVHPKTRRCSARGNRAELHPRPGRPLVAPRPEERTAAEATEDCRWRRSPGTACPHSDGKTWCHITPRPRRTTTAQGSTRLELLRLRPAPRPRRTTDSTLLAPAPPTTRPSARPVVCILMGPHPAGASGGRRHRVGQPSRRTPWPQTPRRPQRCPDQASGPAKLHLTGSQLPGLRRHPTCIHPRLQQRSTHTEAGA